MNMQAKVTAPLTNTRELRAFWLNRCRAWQVAASTAKRLSRSATSPSRFTTR